MFLIFMKDQEGTSKSWVCVTCARVVRTTHAPPDDMATLHPVLHRAGGLVSTVYGLLLETLWPQTCVFKAAAILHVCAPFLHCNRSIWCLIYTTNL